MLPSAHSENSLKADVFDKPVLTSNLKKLFIYLVASTLLFGGSMALLFLKKKPIEKTTSSLSIDLSLDKNEEIVKPVEKNEKVLLQQAIDKFPNLSISFNSWPHHQDLVEFNLNKTEEARTVLLNQYDEKVNLTPIVFLYDKKTILTDNILTSHKRCFYLPSEKGKQLTNFSAHLISYCFLNNTFIGGYIYAPNNKLREVEDFIKSSKIFTDIAMVEKYPQYIKVGFTEENAIQTLQQYKNTLISNFSIKN